MPHLNDFVRLARPPMPVFEMGGGRCQGLAHPRPRQQSLRASAGRSRPRRFLLRAEQLSMPGGECCDVLLWRVGAHRTS
jgi:hypothetical protein